MGTVVEQSDTVSENVQLAKDGGRAGQGGVMGAVRGFGTRSVYEQLRHPEAPQDDTKLTGGSKKGKKSRANKGVSEHTKIMRKAGWPDMPIGGEAN